MGATILLSISGLALIVAGIFKSTPPGAESTPSGLIHGMAFFCTFIPLPTAYALAALRLKVDRGWGAHAVYSAAMPSVVFGLVVVYGVLGSDPGDPLFFVGGILNRVLITLAFGWVTITAWMLFRDRGQRAGAR
jgi:ABC-type spermidine/putrescine transport system permease subunit II